MRLLEKLENRPLKIRCKEDQETIIRSLSGSELDLLVDLRPFMQRDPFIVQSDASLSRAYRLFRTMGLRHLFVCPPRPKVGATYRLHHQIDYFTPFDSAEGHINTWREHQQQPTNVFPDLVSPRLKVFADMNTGNKGLPLDAGHWCDHKEGHSRGQCEIGSRAESQPGLDDALRPARAGQHPTLHTLWGL